MSAAATSTSFFAPRAAVPTRQSTRQSNSPTTIPVSALRREGSVFSGAWAERSTTSSARQPALALPANIIDCYAAIIRMWEPGDRIYLFGFSRGAYTARCVGAVLALCGVPQLGMDGKSLKLDPASTRAVAATGVKKVYQHVSSPKDSAYIEQRNALGQWFRKKFGSDNNGGSNAYPYFIGVFDTVASVATWMRCCLPRLALLRWCWPQAR